MRVLEKLLWAIFFLGCILKFFLILGGGTLIVFALLFLAFMYLLLGFALTNSIKLKTIFNKSVYNEISTNQLIISIIVGFSLSIMVTGVLCKIQSYRFANILLILGLTISAISFIMVQSNSDRNFLHNRRLILITCLGLVFTILTELALVKIQFRNFPTYIELYKEYQENSQNIVLKKELEKEYIRIMAPQEYYDYLYDIEND